MINKLNLRLMAKKFRKYDSGDGRMITEYVRDYNFRDEMKDVVKEEGKSLLMTLLNMLGGILIEKSTKR